MNKSGHGPIDSEWMDFIKFQWMKWVAEEEEEEAAAEAAAAEEEEEEEAEELTEVF